MASTVRYSHKTVQLYFLEDMLLTCHGRPGIIDLENLAWDRGFPLANNPGRLLDPPSGKGSQAQRAGRMGGSGALRLEVV